MVNYLSTKWLPLVGTLLLATAWLPPVMEAGQLAESVQVKSVTTEPAGRSLRVEVQLMNTSTQLITGYSLAATVVFANGKMAHGEITRDMAWVLVNQKLGFPLATNEVFGPGQATTSTIDVPIEAGAEYQPGVSPAPQASAAVMMVAFADKTALGSAQSIAALAGLRGNQADEAGDLAADLASLRGASDLHVTVRELISKAQTKRAGASLSDGDRHLAERRLSALQRYAVPIAEHPETLPVMTQAWQMRSEVLREHSSLRRIGTGTDKLEERQ